MLTKCSNHHVSISDAREVVKAFASAHKNRLRPVFDEKFIDSEIKNKNEIKNAIKNCMKSYRGNWILDAFDYKRMNCICEYIKMKFNISVIYRAKENRCDIYKKYNNEDISHEIIESIYIFVLKELSQMDIKPYDEQ